MAGVIVLILIILTIPSVIKEQREQRELQRVLKRNSIVVSDFLSKKQSLVKRGYNTQGVYIFTNLSKKNRKYVGQSVNLVYRVETHIKGKGNPDLYKDLIKGDTFVVELIKLKDTSFKDLNGLERHYIAKHDSFYNGYNKTRGNF